MGSRFGNELSDTGHEDDNFPEGFTSPNSMSANAPAIVEAWYPGESQGTALADILFGDVNPSARLSSSWPVSEASLPPWNPSALQHQYPSVAAIGCVRR